LGQRRAAIEVRFTLTKKVQVRSIQEQDSHGFAG
jgi:hypothetical protein